MSSESSVAGVHIWRAQLDAVPAVIDELPRLAPEDEVAQAGSLRSTITRTRYAASRIFLRTTLSHYLGLPARDIVISRSPSGKPHVPGTDLEFNLTHSAHVALLALATGRPVGIDVERAAPESSALDIARRFFNPVEHAALSALPHDELRDAFYATWTRKEAFLKGLGLGILGHLNRFTVSTSPRCPARLLRVDWDPSLVGRWSLTDLDIGEGFAACLACSGGRPEIDRFLWPRDCGA